MTPCVRCGTLTPTPGVGVAALCPACPLGPACGEEQHTSPGGVIDGIPCWQCVVCGAVLASHDIEVREPVVVPVDDSGC